MRNKDEKTLLYNTLESLDEHRVGWTWAIWQMSTGLANRKTWDQTSHVTSTYLSAHLFMSVFLCPLINLPAALPCLYTCLSVSAFIFIFFSSVSLPSAVDKQSAQGLMSSLFFLFPSPYYCHSICSVVCIRTLLSVSFSVLPTTLIAFVLTETLENYYYVCQISSVAGCVCVGVGCVCLILPVPFPPLDTACLFNYDVADQWSASI